jgi:hypothetical protein
LVVLGCKTFSVEVLSGRETATVLAAALSDFLDALDLRDGVARLRGSCAHKKLEHRHLRDERRRP